MESPNLVKVVAAFVAGVVIALGSALIYVRASEIIHPPPAPVAQTALEAAPEAVPAAVNVPPAPIRQEAETPSAPPAAMRSTRVIASPANKKLSSRSTARKQIVVVPPPRHPQPKIATPQLAATRSPSVPVTRPVKYDVLQSDEAVPDAPAVAEAPTTLDAKTVADPPAVSDTPTPEPLPPVTGTQPHVVTLAAGMPIPIRLAETLSTNRNYTGDTFRGTLAEPIISDGFIIADRGSKVLGRIINANRGSLRLTLTEINTTDGQRVALYTDSFNHKDSSRTGQDVATIAGGAVLGALIGAAAGGDKGAAIGAGFGGAAGTGVALAMPRKTGNLPVETRLTFRLVNSLTITERLN